MELCKQNKILTLLFQLKFMFSVCFINYLLNKLIVLNSKNDNAFIVDGKSWG